MILRNGWAAAFIADGVGSAKHSDVGAFLAISTVIDHIKKACPKKWDIRKISLTLRNAYTHALDNISRRAVKDGKPLCEYDTTLTVAIYNGNQIAYAHVGDGGIVTLSKSGDFSILTTPQKGGEFNTVQPLRSEKWVFGTSDKDVCAFAMFTDGIYDIVCPWILSEQKQPIYVNYIRPFLDRNLIKVDKMMDFIKIKREIEEFLDSEYNDRITDDKTIAAVINMDVLPAVKPPEYYAEPDWERLQKETRKRLYS
jgi:serine/threonine protein phosphatase PrpC